jgi:hypothetical protein
VQCYQLYHGLYHDEIKSCQNVKFYQIWWEQVMPKCENYQLYHGENKSCQNVKIISHIMRSSYAKMWNFIRYIMVRTSCIPRDNVHLVLDQHTYGSWILIVLGHWNNSPQVGLGRIILTQQTSSLWNSSKYQFYCLVLPYWG